MGKGKRSKRSKRSSFLSTPAAKSDIERRDFGDYGSGRPDFIEWCFYAPWKEPSREMPSFTRDWRKRRSSVVRVNAFQRYSHRTSEITGSSRSMLVSRISASRRSKLDPRSSLMTDVLSRHTFYRDGAAPLCNVNVLSAISSLTASYCRYNCLPMDELTGFTNEWVSDVSSSDLLRLWSYVPRCQLITMSEESLSNVLKNVLMRFLDEHVTAARKRVTALRQLFERQTLNVVWPNDETSSTFLDEGTGRIWLFPRVDHFYFNLAKKIVEFQQLNAYTDATVSNHSNERPTDSLLLTSEEIDESPREYESFLKRSAKNTDIAVREMFSKTLLVLEIARISHDFFDESFEDLLRLETDGWLSKRNCCAMKHLFESAMRRGNVIVAIPYSLFVPRHLVEKYCIELESNENCLRHYIARLAVRYMLHVRGFKRSYRDVDESAESTENADENVVENVANVDDKVNDRVGSTDDDDEEYGDEREECVDADYILERSLMRAYDRFAKKTFSLDGNDRGDSKYAGLMSISLESVLRHHGLTYALVTLMEHAMPDDFLSLMHNYFAFTTWNFLVCTDGKW